MLLFKLLLIIYLLFFMLLLLLVLLLLIWLLLLSLMWLLLVLVYILLMLTSHFFTFLLFSSFFHQSIFFFPTNSTVHLFIFQLLCILKLIKHQLSLFSITSCIYYLSRLSIILPLLLIGYCNFYTIVSDNWFVVVLFLL